jgi:hypothetical protein
MFYHEECCLGILRRLALIRTDVSTERIASIIKVIRIGDPGTTLAVTTVFLRSVLRLLVAANVPSSRILFPLMMEVIVPPERRCLQERQGVTSQKAAFFIVIAMKPPSLTMLCHVLTCKINIVCMLAPHMLLLTVALTNGICILSLKRASHVD